MSNPIYTQKQIQAILSKATELQQNSGSESEQGLTLEELEQIASDSGIDPDFIHQAITQLDASPKQKFSWRNLGGEYSVEMAREFDSPLTDEAWQNIVHEARRSLKKSGGTVQQIGKSKEWLVSDQKFVQASLSATPKGKSTKLFISTSFGKVKFLTYYFAFVLLTMGVGIGLGSADDISTITGMAIALFSAITTFSIARGVYGIWVSAQKSKINKLIDRCKEILSDSEVSAEPLLDSSDGFQESVETEKKNEKQRSKV